MGVAIAVVSGKGGTGKTSLVGGIGASLAALEKRVLCLDMDLGLKNLDITLGMVDETAMDFTDVTSRRYNLKQSAAEHPEIPGLYLLTSPLSIRPSEVDERTFSAMLRKIRRKFHYCLIDAPAGLGDGFSLAAKYADMAIVTATIDLASQRGAGLARQALERMGIKKSYLVVNRAVPKMMSKAGLNIDDMMDTVGLPLLGVVPEDSAVFEAASSGTAIALFNKKRALLAYANIARRITGQRVPLMKI